jgi:hypothetical protein
MDFRPPERDFETFDFLVPIILLVRQPDQTDFYRYGLKGCLRAPLDKRAAIQAGYDLGEEVMVFQVWKHALDRARAYAPAVPLCPRPKVTDQVIDSEGVTWVVRSVEEDVQKTYIRMTCQKAPG